MTNEELAERIQQGEANLLPQLWEQLQRFVYQLAHKWSKLKNAEYDDLVQSGYLALVDAVSKYDPAETVAFITYFAIHLQRQFRLCRAAAAGWTIGTYQRAENAIMVCSLNMPVRGADGEDGETELLDTIADPNDAYEELIKRDYTSTLQQRLNEHLNCLSETERRVLRLRYGQCLTQSAISKLLNIPYSEVRNTIDNALHELRKPCHRRELEAWVDERTNYTLHIGVKSFHSGGYSSVEHLVERRENMRNHLLSGGAVAWG